MSPHADCTRHSPMHNYCQQMHAQHILFIVSSSEGYRLVFHSMCIFCVYGMALYWPTLQLYLCHTHRLLTGTWRPLVSVITTLYYVAMNIFHRWVWYRALWRYSKFRHHPHPLGYLCAKFRFFCGLHCWASPWGKIVCSVNQSTNQPITHPAYLMPREPKLVLRKTKQEEKCIHVHK